MHLLTHGHRYICIYIYTHLVSATFWPELFAASPPRPRRPEAQLGPDGLPSVGSVGAARATVRGAIMVMAAMVIAIMRVCGKNHQKLIVHDVGPHPSP